MTGKEKMTAILEALETNPTRLARELMLAQSTILKIITGGTKKISASLAAKLAEKKGVSIEYIKSGKLPILLDKADTTIQANLMKNYNHTSGQIFNELNAMNYKISQLRMDFVEAKALEEKLLALEFSNAHKLDEILQLLKKE